MGIFISFPGKLDPDKIKVFWHFFGTFL